MTPERWRAIRDVFDSVLALPGPERQARLEILTAHDADLRVEVSSLLEAHEDAKSTFMKRPAVAVVNAQPAADAAFRGRRVGAYQLLEPIGRGGMGEVYRATRVDGQYSQDVAVKLVHAGFGTGLLIERFRNERQILAGLEHANIARLLDGGTTEDGVPYLVMERVVGVPIDQYCDAHRLSVDARLALFRQVCDAVAYAHQHLVIHRDLKPSNILVTDAGAPKLLDFGIAKILDAPASTETTLLRPMTPEYASPEQLRGGPVTTATDVYSLGVVLYRLLTGRSPYRPRGAALQDLADAVTDAEPARPSTVVPRRVPAAHPGDEGAAAFDRICDVREGSPARLRRRLRGDLDDIVMKALRKEPANRYPSVEQLSEDIRRHLDGLPVRASKGSWQYRAGKFLRRHRTLVGASGVVLTTIVIGALVTAREARLAEANARRAEARFSDVRQLANALIFEVHDAIQDLPGSTPVRELIVKRALEYLDRLSREAGTDASLRRELALAYEKVGAVQGAPDQANLGNSQGALESYRKALAIRVALARAAPGDERARVDLARDDGQIGALLLGMDDLPAALDSYEQGLAILAAIPQPATGTKVELQKLAIGYGIALTRSGQLQRAVDGFQRAVALGAELARDDPAVPAFRHDWAIAYKNLGDGQLHMGRLQDALASYRAGRDLLAPLAATGSAPWRRDLGVLEERLADGLMRLGNMAESLALRQKILAADLESARADPANARARRDVYVDYYKLSRTQFLGGDTAGALASQRTSLEFIRKELAANPANAVARDDAQIGYYHLGDILKRTGQMREALASYLRAQEIAQQLMTASPNDLTIRVDYAEGEIAVADMQLAVGDRNSALAGYRSAISRCEDLVQKNPANSEWRTVLAVGYERLGHFFAVEANGRPASAARRDRTEARRWLQKSVALWTDVREHEELTGEAKDEARMAADELARVESALATGRP